MMTKHNPQVFATEITHVSECAFERAIILGKYSILDGKRVDWLDIEIPVALPEIPETDVWILLGRMKTEGTSFASSSSGVVHQTMAIQLKQPIR